MHTNTNLFMKDILLDLAQELGYSQSAFSLKLGYSRGYLHQCGDNYSSKTLRSILTLFPNVNPYYLIYGRGEMFVNFDNHNSNITKLAKNNADWQTLYINIQKMFDNVTAENEQLKQTIKQLTAQNSALITELDNTKKVLQITDNK